MPRYDLVFDGGSRGNPGPGYGSFRSRAAGGEWSGTVRLDFRRSMTGNEAEYRTLVAALTQLADGLDDPAAAVVDVRSDSQLVLHQLKGEWKVHAHNLLPLYHAVQTAASRFAHVTYAWQTQAASLELLGH